MTATNARSLIFHSGERMLVLPVDCDVKIELLIRNSYNCRKMKMLVR